MIQNNNNEAEKVHFAVMAIGAAADLMGISPSEMHKRLDKVGLVKNLLFDLYDVEHTLSLQHVAEDVVEALNNWEKTEKSNMILLCIPNQAIIDKYQLFIDSKEL